MNSLSKTVTRQRRGCDLNPGPSALVAALLRVARVTAGLAECNDSLPPGL